MALSGGAYLRLPYYCRRLLCWHNPVAAQITNGANAVNTNHIADNAVGSAQIADDGVGSAQIAANSVGSSQLADNAVDTAQIANNSLNLFGGPYVAVRPPSAGASFLYVGSESGA